MRTFKQFLTEAPLSFDTSDSSPDAKAKGRAAIVKSAAIEDGTFADMQSYFKKATDANIKDAYNAFVSAYPAEAKAINASAPNGVGPGELVVYFVFDNIGVGGKNADIDLFINGKPFAEVKAGRKFGANALNNFKISKDGDKAVSQLLKDLDAFNARYEELTGNPLDGWQDSGKANTSPLRKWRDIDLSKLKGGGGSKKSIDLVLKKDGDLLRKGDSDPLLNVMKAKGLAPIKKLLSDKGETATPDEISTIEKIEKRWVDQVFTDYARDKTFAFIETVSLRMRFFGKLSKDQVELDYTNRNQPYARVYMEPKSKDKVEATE